jgi:hypothetical protein
VAAIGGGGGGGGTVDQIIAAEQQRGQYDWTGPGGNADAFALLNDVGNVDVYAYLANAFNIGYALGKIG